jgi:hypothetical protein
MTEYPQVKNTATNAEAYMLKCAGLRLLPPNASLISTTDKTHATSAKGTMSVRPFT